MLLAQKGRKDKALAEMFENFSRMLMSIREVADMHLIFIIFLYYVGNFDFLTFEFITLEMDSDVAKVSQFYQIIKLIA